MKLFNIVKIKEDEILYSYLLRLSRANGFDDLREFLGVAKILPHYEDEKNVYRFVRYDIHSDLYPLLNAIECSAIGVAELYRATSLFPITSLVCSRAITSHRIGMLSRYRCRTSLITPLEDTFQGVKFCPCCRKNDLEADGEWHYYRSHQIPGVTVCHHHGCALCLFQGKRGFELDLEQLSTEKDVKERSLEYAKFAHDLLTVDLDADINIISHIVLNRMKELGYSKQTLDQLQKDMGTYVELLNTPLKTFFRWFPSKSQCDLQTCITLILYLFGDIKTFLSYLPSNPTPDTETQISHSYELISPQRKDIIELLCPHCQAPFLSSYRRIKSGWGCPDCDAKRTDQELFQHLFETASFGDYELLKFSNMNKKIEIRHSACGRVYSIRSRDFLEESKRCMCGKSSSYAEVERRVDLVGDFDLIHFQSTTMPFRILHKGCGSEFSVNYGRFIRHPKCKICENLSRSEQEFEKEIYELVGEEYKLVSAYKDRKTDVQILHTVCNTVQVYKPQRFLIGARCSKCHQRLTFSDFCLIINEVSYGVYVVEQQIGEYDALILNTKTGETKKMPIVRAMQELFRFTPSKILPLETRNLNVKPTTMVSKCVMDWIEQHYAPGEPISIRDIEIPGMEHKQLSRTVQNLYRANKLIKISYGVYTIPPRQEN